MSGHSSPRSASASSPDYSPSPSPASERAPSNPASHSSGDSDSGHNDQPPVYLGHNRWKQAQPHTPGQRHPLLPTDDAQRVYRRKKIRTKYTYKKVYHEQQLSRDFFLILTFCFVLACFLICLTRPALRSWLSGPVSFVDLDEF